MIDADTALAVLRDIRVYTHTDGQRAPYQYLVLLWAISRQRSGHREPVPFQDVKVEVARILSDFAIADTAPDPANPWFALDQSPWWTVSQRVTRYSEISNANVAAGLSKQIIDLLERDPTFAGRAVHAIRAIIGDSPRLDDLLQRLQLSNLPSYRLIPVENNTAETFTVGPAMKDAQRARREALLQNEYKEYLENRNHEVFSLEIPVDGQLLRVDLYDRTTDELIEVKASVDRNTIRLALGQILDYAHIVKPKFRTILVPSEPAQGLLEMLRANNIQVLWQDADGRFNYA
ncbi:hypothetical protein BST16_06645 [Mycobacterium asiaticum DSM 44297]|nr:hypothetical protein BST16_06645 [Mycobacterium asiaticum DSM 44297]